MAASSEPDDEAAQEAALWAAANAAFGHADDPSTLIGENLLLKAEGVSFMTSRAPAPIPGTLYITEYQLVFLAKVKTAVVPAPVPLGCIETVGKIGGQTSRGDNSYCLEIATKDARKLRFCFVPQNHSRRSVHQTLQEYAFPGRQELTFAFKYAQRFPVNGWDVYDPRKELARMGVPNKEWRVTEVNADYSVCDSYPKVLGVPALATDDTLRLVAQFRSKGRIPALTWLHPRTGASITRCAQPRPGITSKRSAPDEELVRIISDTDRKTGKLYILDARPRANAMAQTAMGAGYEHVSNYPNCDLKFLNIGNIHVMRESLAKWREANDPEVTAVEETKWMSSLEAAKWLEHVKLVVTAALRAVELVEQGSSVMVHCSDGWDRTSQIGALAQLMLDPYYRTIRGFAVLVEKDWLSFGHKMARRTGHADKNASDDQRAPIFLQFMDCVWQFTQQFPTACEFNGEFLLFVLDGVYDCKFGTFLYNNDRERVAAKVRELTVSIWSPILSDAKRFTNSLYREEGGVLEMAASIKRLRVWGALYMRYHPEFVDEAAHVNARVHDLLAEVEKAATERAELEKEVQRLKDLCETYGLSKMES